MAVYTNTLKDFLDEYETNGIWVSIINKFDTFPYFVYKEQGASVDSYIDLYNAFKLRYFTREIATETNERFPHVVEKVLMKCFLKYANKIQKAKEIIDSINLSTSYIESDVLDSDSSSTAESNQYLNPVTTASTRVQAKNGSSTTGMIDNTLTKNKIYIQVPSEMLDTVKKATNFYIEILDEFETCFFQLY